VFKLQEQAAIKRELYYNLVPRLEQRFTDNLPILRLIWI